jgi:hypothetical protein
MKAEQFIKDYTNHCSNEMVFEDGSGSRLYEPWITPDQALRAVEIAREEMIEKVQDWIADPFKYDGSEDFNGGADDAMSILLDEFTNYMERD